MSEAMAPLPPDSAIMQAWKAYQETESFKNSFRWVTEEQRKELLPPSDPTANAVTDWHRDQWAQGSMWAAFMRGWLARAEHLPAEPQEAPDAADAARYRYLKEHSSYYYAEGYDPPTPREFGIVWEHQDSTPDRPSMDWLIDQEIEAKRLEALEDEAAEAEEDASTLSRPEGK